MHCKSCLKVSKYFSKCMHPYCEKCYKTKIYCSICKTGKTDSIMETLLKYLKLY